MAFAAVAVIATVIGARATPAAAAELAASEDHERVLEGSAFLKGAGTYVHMPAGLVDGTEALQSLADAAARTAAPRVAIPANGAMGTQTARVWGRLLWGERLEFDAGWQLASIVASDPAFATGSTLGGGFVASGGSGAKRRLVDFDPTLAQSSRFRLQHDLDLLAVKVRAPFGDVTVGRQVLSWGSGHLWNPTDLLSPFAPTDIDREVRRGVDAVRVLVPLAATAQLDMLWLAQPQARDQGAVLRGQFNLGGFDLAPSLAKYVRDVVVGFDATGDLGPLGVHGEVAWTRALDRNAAGGRDSFARAVAGIDVRPSEALVLSGECYFNGWGARDAAGYLSVLTSDRVRRGEVFGAGRHYLGLTASWKPSELLTVQTTAIANLADPSAMVVPALEYWAEQNVLVRVGASLPLGRGPSLGLRSEYGASPFGAFVQVGVYMP